MTKGYAAKRINRDYAGNGIGEVTRLWRLLVLRSQQSLQVINPALFSRAVALSQLSTSSAKRAASCGA